jgi:hypothetical protein
VTNMTTVSVTIDEPKADRKDGTTRITTRKRPDVF